MATYIPKSVYDSKAVQKELDHLNEITSILVNEDDKDARHKIARVLLVSQTMAVMLEVAKGVHSCPESEIQDWLYHLHTAKREFESEDEDEE